MIRSVHVHNLRRLAEATITFDPTAQLVLVAGRNGVGKSSLFEAVLWALYGESRHGRRDLDGMIRRGCEEMTVTVTFAVDGVDYLATRSRSRSGTKAELRSGGVLLADRSSTVTEEVTALLGLDGTGFRLAYLAQQGELDGLTSLRPAERTAAVGRLLRLDLLQSARDEAKRTGRAAKAALDALGPEPDRSRLRDEVQNLNGQEQAADDALSAAREAFAAAVAEEAGGAHLDDELARVAERRARAEGRLGEIEQARNGLLGRVERLEVEAGSLVEAGDVTALASDLSAVERSLATAEVNRVVAAGRALAREELAAAERALAALDGAMTGVEAEATLLLAQASRVEAETRLVAARGHEATVAAAEAAARSRTQAAAERVETVAALAGACPTCASELTDEHHRSLVDEARRVWADERAEADLLGDKLLHARSDVTTAEAVVASCKRAEEDARSARHHADLDDQTRADLCERRDVAIAQLAASADIEESDVDDLRAERDRLSDLLRLARRAQQVRGELDDARSQLEQVTATMNEARDEIEAIDAEGSLTRLAVQRRQLRERREAEAALVAELEVGLATLQGQRALAAQRLQAAVDDRRRRRELAVRASDSADAATVLDRASQLLASRLRPALSAAVSDVLGRLSSGRFAGVTFDSEYTVGVIDDGAPRRLDELSGGEQDLVALAMRLGLAEVVGASSGWGALWLDEVLGSQDAERRQMVLDALRALRGRWPQVVVVSHVDGMEDAVDQVINLTRDDAVDVPVTRAEGESGGAAGTAA